jgi:hypothetical protein
MIIWASKFTTTKRICSNASFFIGEAQSKSAPTNGSQNKSPYKIDLYELLALFVGAALNLAAPTNAR